jgi:secreted trypsin-like serine protease
MQMSNSILKGEVEEIPLDECRLDYKDKFRANMIAALPDGITDGLLCAKNRNKTVDTCRGDSGTALKYFQDGNFYIVGITSFGISCQSKLPSFYTRVSHYLDWIEEIVWSSPDSL